MYKNNCYSYGAVQSDRAAPVQGGSYLALTSFFLWHVSTCNYISWYIPGLKILYVASGASLAHPLHFVIILLSTDTSPRAWLDVATIGSHVKYMAQCMR